jgi:LacI family transcriptional regulator
MSFNKVTIKDVAAKAGVSPSTVSRVVGGYGYVKNSTKIKVEKAIKELDYKPNTLARSMITKSTKTIGIVVTDITNPFFASVIRSIEDYIWKSGYAILLANTDENVDREKAVISAIIERQVDGLILVPSIKQLTPHLELLTKRDIPVVLVDRMVEGLSADAVMVDNENGAFTAVNHLISKGHKRIGVIIDDLNISTNHERLLGYKKALNLAGLPFDPSLIKSCKFTSKSAFELVSTMLSQDDRPSGLFCANNFMTLGTLQAIVQTKTKIPEEISLVGFDDIYWFSTGSQQVSTVSQPVKDLGIVAASRLLDRLNGDKNSPMEIRLKTHFIDRGSCGVLKS